MERRTGVILLVGILNSDFGDVTLTLLARMHLLSVRLLCLVFVIELFCICSLDLLNSI